MTPDGWRPPFLNRSLDDHETYEQRVKRFPCRSIESITAFPSRQILPTAYAVRLSKNRDRKYRKAVTRASRLSSLRGDLGFHHHAHARTYGSGSGGEIPLLRISLQPSEGLLSCASHVFISIAQGLLQPLDSPFPSDFCQCLNSRLADPRLFIL
jgi:hypothetical protein